ncbi:alpha-amylase family glycosyl hydrolase [Microbulbifer sp. 2304DJ12-6]|uniref:alpha-amylase family glycosyl hydrolase n=1 Tax=Microbulbifer sp. 2304DJ12-6 TaxID=3233340 RepID=UPI0039B0F542
MKKLVSVAAALCLMGLGTASATAADKRVVGAQVDPFWRNASVYFLLPDRFANGDPGNDRAYGRKDDAERLRGFAGGDLHGVLDKLEAGYFRDLGVTALWMSPVVEQVQGYDEGDGRTYAYHGYWPRDWTAVDANFGSEADLRRVIETAHSQGIRVLLDVILNHTGPVTKRDPLWPAAWVRTAPVCDWKNFAGNVHCALTSNLPDIRTESEQPVDLPPHLVAKWRREGRLQQEQRELDAFFARTGYPRAPKYYIVKWLTDWVREYGVDGFRVDTAKHVEPEIWAVLKKEASLALAQWKANHPDKKPDDRGFFMLGEVYHFGVDDFGPTKGRVYNFGDRQVDFFAYGFDSLINMGFAQHAAQSPQDIFSRYSSALHGGALDGLGVLNYLGSHDDHHSFDRERKQVRTAALKLMLAPGAAQIYYGDEIARPMIVKDARGDASMRSLMNWEDLERSSTQALLDHWRKLGQFRRANLALGAGEHRKLADKPYTFSRTLEGEPPVLVALGVETGNKSLPVYGLFADGTLLKDYYSGTESPVAQGRVHFNTDSDLLLLGIAPGRE